MPIDAFPVPLDPSLTSARAKTYRLLLASAMALYDEGAFPSITELAAHAQVSRATAYRYFPTQSALISAVVAESLGPILEWRPQDDDALKRIQQLLSFAYPQMERHEGRCVRRCSSLYSSGRTRRRAKNSCAATASVCWRWR